MGAPGTMSANAPKQNGLKKLFGRRTSHNSSNNTKDSSSSPAVPEECIETPRNSNATPLPTQPSAKSLSASRQERKKGKRWGSVFKRSDSSNNGQQTSSHESSHHHKDDPDVVTVEDLHSPVRIVVPQDRPASFTKLTKQDFVPWQESLKEEDPNKTLLMQKQLVKERDGFCRRVDSYDGQVIAVAGRPAYELGSYLGGGVAGVVYEGHRLRPMEEYPVRLGRGLGRNDMDDNQSLVESLAETRLSPPGLIDVSLFTCGPGATQSPVNDDPNKNIVPETTHFVNGKGGPPHNGSVLTWDSTENETSSIRRQRMCQEEAALELTASNDQMVLIDDPDAPSRSSHYAKAVSMHHVESQNSNEGAFPSDASISYSLMEETVAIKVLNPVGFRTMDSNALQSAVVARAGDDLGAAVLDGEHPMEERHVWWLVNPNSRNLRTLQRYPPEQKGPRRVQVDRGSPEKGLRISLIAAYRDKDDVLRELPLTRCIEIWGHVPFGASDEAFSSLVAAIDAINSGRPPPPMPAFWDLHQTQPTFMEIPGRIGTGSTANTTQDDVSLESLPMASRRTGIFRAATSHRTTVYCEALSAYIALPAVPSKYIKWLRQRRAATKEIRNMMLIGRHKNVVHLFEVLEHIQENKSTMFLILELVRGGELFDLISSGAAKLSRQESIPPGFTETETVMRKFFAELAAGVRYCHSNGIAHRDLKPENLLVHNQVSGECTLKIADFGLSAAFGPNGESQQYDDNITLAESFISSMAPTAQAEDVASLNGNSLAGNSMNNGSTNNSTSHAQNNNSDSPIKRSMDRLLTASGTALSFFTCGVVDDVLINSCAPRTTADDEPAAPLKRMTSVVGSPHYVAPEIISQNDIKRRDKKGEAQAPGVVVGYDGTKADVWSAGVILYAMLFRSLPFGEDLLRCPRYQSFSKWYTEVKSRGGRRSTTLGFLKPLTEVEERDMLGPQWFFPSQTSVESRDLIVAMLNPDPDIRPNINQVLKHPWLKKQAVLQKSPNKR